MGLGSFLKDTVKGFVSSGGNPWGAVAGFGKSVLDHRNAKKQNDAQNRLNSQSLVRLRQSAEDAGFHPLEALRAGASVPHTAGPRLWTSLSKNNVFDTLEDELTGEGAKQRRRQQVEDEIRERELERLEVDIANSQINRPTVGGNGRPILHGSPKQGMENRRPPQKPGYWTGPSIPVKLPTGDTLQMPKRLADRLDIAQWDPVIADDFEAIAGDEISQVIFGDWLASNGLVVRNGNIEKSDVYTTGDAAEDVKDYFGKKPAGTFSRRENR